VSSDSFYFEKDKSDNILIMGVGNYLMGDEGVGVRIIEEMACQPLPSYIDLLDGGTGGFLLLDRFQAYGTVVFVDATMDGAEPGTLRLTRPRFASDFPTALSVHDLGLKDMIEAVYLLDHKPDLYLLTVSIGGIDPMSVDLSEAVAAAVPRAAIRLRELGKELFLEKKPLGGHI
jgi:hydrogenase maturation protease